MFTALQVAEGQCPHADADQAAHQRPTDRLKHPPNLPLAPLVDDELDPGTAFLYVANLDLGWLGSRLLQGDAAAQLLKLLLGRHAVYLHVVFLLHAIAGVSQAEGEIAVVGEQQQTFTAIIQPPNGVDALFYVGDQLHHCWPLLVVADRSHVATWLVQHDVDMGLTTTALEWATIDLDLVGGGVNTGTKNGDNLAIDADTAPLDQPLTGPPASNSRVSQHLLQANTVKLLLLLLWGIQIRNEVVVQFLAVVARQWRGNRGLAPLQLWPLSSSVSDQRSVSPQWAVGRHAVSRPLRTVATSPVRAILLWAEGARSRWAATGSEGVVSLWLLPLRLRCWRPVTLWWGGEAILLGPVPLRTEGTIPLWTEGARTGWAAATRPKRTISLGPVALWTEGTISLRPVALWAEGTIPLWTIPLRPVALRTEGPRTGWAAATRPKRTIPLRPVALWTEGTRTGWAATTRPKRTNPLRSVALWAEGTIPLWTRRAIPLRPVALRTEGTIPLWTISLGPVALWTEGTIPLWTIPLGPVALWTEGTIPLWTERAIPLWTERADRKSVV